MAVLRFTRDKRGYEHFYLVQPSQRRDKSGSRVLYWFRTPPNVKVGREPFDEAVRRELEAQNPDIVFDWRRILETPIPSADAEKWRERRRVEKAARLARRAVVQEAPAEPDGDDSDETVAEASALDAPALNDEAAGEPLPGEQASDEPLSAEDSDVEPPEHVLEAAAEAAAVDAQAPAAAAEPSSQHRRRRRRRRRRHGPPSGSSAPPATPGGDV